VELFQLQVIAPLEGYGLCHTCELLFASQWSAAGINTPRTGWKIRRPAWDRTWLRSRKYDRCIARSSVAGRAAGAVTAQMGTGDMLRLELAEEQKAILDYAEAIAHIMDDERTLDLLEEHLLDEIHHSRWMKARIMELE
jgi:hypothetical protein